MIITAPHICPAMHHPCPHPKACDGFCDINTEKLDRVMNYPLRQPAADLAEPAEPDGNHPWDWIDDLRFLFACALAGFSAAFGWAFGSFISTF